VVKKSKNSKPGGERDNESSLFNTFGKKNKNKKKPPRTSSLFENDSSSTSSLSPVLNVNSMVTRDNIYPESTDYDVYDETNDHSLKPFQYERSNDFDIDDIVDMESTKISCKTTTHKHQDSATELDETYGIDMYDDMNKEVTILIDNSNNLPKNVIVTNTLSSSNNNKLRNNISKDQIPWRHPQHGYKLMLCFANMVYYHSGHVCSYGETKKTWETITTCFSKEDIMKKYSANIQPQTLQKKFKVMLHDNTLNYCPKPDEIESFNDDNDNNDDELNLKCRLYIIREEIEESKLKAEQEKIEKQLHKEHLDKLSNDVIHNSSIIKSRPKSHGTITPASTNSMNTYSGSAFTTPSSASFDNMINALMGRQQNALITGPPLSNIPQANTNSNNVEYVIKTYSHMSKLLLKDCNFMVECGIPAEEVTKIDLGYLTVGSLISVYKESYKSIGEFNKNGVATLELPPRALSTIYAYLSNLDYKI
jgi:hypothetical protein